MMKYKNKQTNNQRYIKNYYNKLNNKKCFNVKQKKTQKI